MIARTSDYVFVSIVVGMVVMLYINNHKPLITPEYRVPFLPTTTDTELPTHWNLTFWSTDFHISPIADLKHILSPLGVRFIDKSLSGHCHLTHTCAKDLKVLSKDNAYFIGDHPERLAATVKEAYKNDREFAQVDAIVCFHPIATCRLYAPLNKSLIMISSTRYEHGQESASQWQSFNRFIRATAADSRNLLGANSVYDQHYLRYFTGVTPVYLPSLCSYITAQYHPVRAEVLMWSHRSPSTVIDAIYRAFDTHRTSNPKGLILKPVRSVYHHYKYGDLASHPAIVHLPYQISYMSLFEHYWMCIPIFAPSLHFLVELDQQHGLLSERTWGRVRGRGKQTRSPIPAASVSTYPFDPNDEVSAEAMRYWVSMADFYTMPFIQYFDSWPHLFDQLATTNLTLVSANMKRYNIATKQHLLSQWRSLLHRMFPK